MYVRPWLRAALEALPAHEPYVASTYRTVDGVSPQLVFHVPWASAVYEPLALIFLIGVVAWVTGRLVVRLNASASTSSLLAIALTFTLGGWPSWSMSVPGGEEIVFSGVWWNIREPASIAVTLMCLLVGGLWSARSDNANAPLRDSQT
jgi:hypothetical protein